jgi:hypothetical protein
VEATDARIAMIMLAVANPITSFGKLRDESDRRPVPPGVVCGQRV